MSTAHKETNDIKSDSEARQISSGLLGGPPSPKDWTADSAHENGNYQNVCTDCQELFIGHKRRCQCKECAEAAEARWNAMTEDEKAAHMAEVAALIKQMQAS